MSALAERLTFLCEGVVSPLVLGGPVRLMRPFGPKLALDVARGQEVPDPELRSQLSVVRTRVARALAPIDALPPVGQAELALAALLHDLLVASHHELEGTFSSGRASELLEGVVAACEAIEPAQSVGDALALHATFSRLLEVVRVDRRVEWWTGSARFRGQPVPTRLLLWSDLRRVRQDEAHVTLAHMCDDLGPPRSERFVAALGCLLAETPLTDLATCARAAPTFAWAAGTLRLVATPLGSRLAARAIPAKDKSHAERALRTATQALRPGPAAELAAQFVERSFVSAAPRTAGV